MITRLSGIIVERSESDVVLDVHGVGYHVHVTPDTSLSLQKEAGEISLWTHLAVRETALELFGFRKRNELNFFELLLRVPGIGPKSALSVMSVATLDTLRKAIARGDIGYLTKVSGIGKKTADKIILELRDRLDIELGDTGEGALQGESDALEALRNLGYSSEEAREALKASGYDPEKPVAEKIRGALQLLGRSRK